MYIRRTLSAIDNTELALTEPRTGSSRNWAALPDRATAAIAHHLAPDTFRAPDPACTATTPPESPQPPRHHA